MLEQNGNVYLLGVQLLGIFAIVAWTAVTSYVFLKVIDLTMGLRVSEEHERLGADVVMHGLIDTDDCAVAASFHARRKTSAAHHEKTVWADAVARCGCGCRCSNDNDWTPSRSLTLKRDSFLRRTFGHVTHRRESRIGTVPSYWSTRPSIDAVSVSNGSPRPNMEPVSESDGDPRPNSSPAPGQSSDNDRREPVNGVPSTTPDIIYI